MSVRSAVHRASFVSIPPLSRFLSAIPRWFTAARRIVRRPIAHRRAFSKIAKVKSNRYSPKSTNFYLRYFSVISFFPVIGTICQGALETEGRKFFTLLFDGLQRIFDVWFTWENTFFFLFKLVRISYRNIRWIHVDKWNFEILYSHAYRRFLDE